MRISVEAKYENGTLKLAEPLPLDEHETVRVTVQTNRPGSTGSNAGRLDRDDAGLIETGDAGPTANSTAAADLSTGAADGEMVDIWLNAPPSPTARVAVVHRGDPILPAPFRIDESDLAPE